jgi:hypothetical protein
MYVWYWLIFLISVALKPFKLKFKQSSLMHNKSYYHLDEPVTTNFINDFSKYDHFTLFLQNTNLFNNFHIISLSFLQQFCFKNMFNRFFTLFASVFTLFLTLILNFNLFFIVTSRFCLSQLSSCATMGQKQRIFTL